MNTFIILVLFFFVVIVGLFAWNAKRRRYSEQHRAKMRPTALIGMCGRCYINDVPIFPANCIEKPEALAGQPIGMYHCPDCGAMVVAAVEHPWMCRRCIDRTHPGFDVPAVPGKEELPAILGRKAFNDRRFGEP